MKRGLFFFIVILICNIARSQSIGIGEEKFTPHSSAALEIASNKKGVLIPRLTMEERDKIANPAEGLLIYQKDNNPGFYYRNSEKWVPLSSMELKFEDNKLQIGNEIIDFSTLTDNDKYLQQISIEGNTIYLSDGGKIVLPEQKKQSLSLNGALLSISGANTIDLRPMFAENQYQHISMSGDTIYLSDGGYVELDKYKNQELVLENNSLKLSGGKNYVNLARFLDDTDNQKLMLRHDTLFLENGGFVKIPTSGSIELRNDSLITSVSTISLSKYLDNTDNQELSLVNDTLILTGSDSVSLVKYNQILDFDTVKYNLSLSNGGLVELRRFLDNTDEQEIFLKNDTLFLTNGGAIPLSKLTTGSVQIEGDTLRLSNGSSFSLTKYLDNTDEQKISLSNDTIYLTNGNFVKLPKDKVKDDDSDNSNELQNLSIREDTLFISDGNYIILPHYVDENSDELADNDKNPTNEIQTLSISNDTIYLTNGGKVKLPSLDEDIDNQKLYFNNNVLSIEDGNSVDLSSIDTDNQSLTYARLEGTILKLGIENGNGITADLKNLQDGVGEDKQTLSIYGDYLSISNGNKVELDKIDDQQLSISNDTICLTNGGKIKLPPRTVNTDNQDLLQPVLHGNILELKIENGNSASIDLSYFKDNAEDNQQLFINDGFLYISKSNSSVPLSELARDEQTIQTRADSLEISNGNAIPISDVDKQQLYRKNDSIFITNGNGVPLPSNNGSNIQVLYKNETKLGISGGNEIDFAEFIPSQKLKLQSGVLQLDGGGSSSGVNIDELDKQKLSLRNDTLFLTNGGSVKLPKGSSGGTGVAQTLTLTGSSLSISDGNSVNLSSIDTDDQQLSLDGNVLSLTNGGSVKLSQDIVSTDDQKLELKGSTLLIEDGNKVDLSTLNTDKQTIDAKLSGSILGINIQNGNEATVDLGPLLSGSASQNLTIRNDSLVISDGDGILTDEIDNQQLSLSGNKLALTNGGSVTIPVSDLSKEDLKLSLLNGELSIAGGNTVDISEVGLQKLDIDEMGYLVLDKSGGRINLNILDNQELIYDNDTKLLSIEGGDASFDLSSINTDAQQLSIVGNTLYLTNSDPVLLPQGSATQELLLDGTILSITDGENPVDLASAFSDNQAITLELTDAGNLMYSLDRGGSGSLDLSSLNTDNQQLETLTITGKTLTLSLENGGKKAVNLAPMFEGITDPELDDPYIDEENNLFIGLNGEYKSVDLSDFAEGGTDDQNLLKPEINEKTGAVTLKIEDGESTVIPMADVFKILDKNTDNQQLADPVLGTDNVLTIGLEGSDDVEVDLGSLAGGTGGTDDQKLQPTSFDPETKLVTIKLEDGGTTTIDMSEIFTALDTDTDNQQLTEPVLGSDNVLTIGLEGSEDVKVDLSDLAGGTGGTDDQDLLKPEINAKTGAVTLKIEDGESAVIPMADVFKILDTDTDNQEFELPPIVDAKAKKVSLTITNGNTADIDLSDMFVGYEPTTFDEFAVVGDNLSLSIGGEVKTIPLDDLDATGTGTGTDDQNLLTPEVNATTGAVTLKIEDGDDAVIPMEDVFTALQSDFDNQDLTISTPNAAEKKFDISIDRGTTHTVDLSDMFTEFEPTTFDLFNVVGDNLSLTIGGENKVIPLADLNTGSGESVDFEQTLIDGTSGNVSIALNNGASTIIEMDRVFDILEKEDQDLSVSTPNAAEKKFDISIDRGTTHTVDLSDMFTEFEPTTFDLFNVVGDNLSLTIGGENKVIPLADLNTGSGSGSTFDLSVYDATSNTLTLSLDNGNSTEDIDFTNIFADVPTPTFNDLMVNGEEKIFSLGLNGQPSENVNLSPMFDNFEAQLFEDFSITDDEKLTITVGGISKNVALSDLGVGSGSTGDDIYLISTDYDVDIDNNKCDLILTLNNGADLTVDMNPAFNALDKDNQILLDPMLNGAVLNLSLSGGNETSVDLSTLLDQPILDAENVLHFTLGGNTMNEKTVDLSSLAGGSAGTDTYLTGIKYNGAGVYSLNLNDASNVNLDLNLAAADMQNDDQTLTISEPDPVEKTFDITIEGHDAQTVNLKSMFDDVGGGTVSFSGSDYNPDTDNYTINLSTGSSVSLDMEEAVNDIQTDDQTLTISTPDPVAKTFDITIEGHDAQTVNLKSMFDDLGGGSDIDFTSASYDPSTKSYVLTLSNGNFIPIYMVPAINDIQTDNQNLSGVLDGTELKIDIDNGTSARVELEPLISGLGGASELTITDFSYSSGWINLKLSNNNSSSFDLATHIREEINDNQNITATTKGTTLFLNLGLGAGTSIDLTSILDTYHSSAAQPFQTSLLSGTSTTNKSLVTDGSGTSVFTNSLAVGVSDLAETTLPEKTFFVNGTSQFGGSVSINDYTLPADKGPETESIMVSDGTGNASWKAVADVNSVDVQASSSEPLQAGKEYMFAQNEMNADNSVSISLEAPTAENTGNKIVVFLPHAQANSAVAFNNVPVFVNGTTYSSSGSFVLSSVEKKVTLISDGNAWFAFGITD